jgi:hypothetical protein
MNSKYTSNRLYKRCNFFTSEVIWELIHDARCIEFDTIENLIKYCDGFGIDILSIDFIWNGGEIMDNIVEITRRDNSNISYQGKVLEKYDSWCKIIAITERGAEVWDCHDDFWDIKYGVKILKIKNK